MTEDPWFSRVKQYKLWRYIADAEDPFKNPVGVYFGSTDREFYVDLYEKHPILFHRLEAFRSGIGRNDRKLARAFYSGIHAYIRDNDLKPTN